MKKLFIILSAAALVFAACSKNEVPEKESVHISFSAVLDNPEPAVPSKTELVAGNKVNWLSGDAITIFDGNANERYETSDSGASATFEADLSEGTPYYALYPYSDDAVISAAGNITTTLPAVQKAKAGSFAEGLNISVAKTETSTLEFKNVLSYLKFQVPAENIKRVTIKGSDNEDLAGKFVIKINDAGVPIINEIKAGANFVTLLPPEGSSTFATGVNYYIALLPGTLENGFWLLFTYSDNTIGVSSTANSAPFTRKKILNIGAPTLAKGTDVISFRDPVATAAFGSDFTVADAAATTTLPDAVKSGITYFDEFVFFGLTGGNNDFYNNASLKQIILPSGITSLNSNAFRNCSSLESIIINDKITGFASYSLASAAKVNSLLIPQALNNISGNAFTGSGNIIIYFLQPTPPTSVTGSAFKSTYTFWIPSGSQSDYESKFSGVSGTINYIEY